jgi:cutinase
LANLITRASTQCPASKLVVSGYSQGAALVHGAVKRLGAAARARIFAAVTFGDTQRQQDGGQIPGIPASNTLILCNAGDRVCEGTLIITSAHLDYTGSVGTAANFISARVR